MRSAYAVQDVRAAEESVLSELAALPEGALMQRASAGLARVCVLMLGKVYGSRVLLLVGSGDNGGDALFAGARLADRGARVDAVLLGDRAHEAGLAALKRAGGRVVDDVSSPRLWSTLRADLVVDGIVGIGGRGALRGRAADVVAGLGGGPMVVAVDVPSGVDADTGEVAGAAVRADVTVTFGALKPGLLVDPGAGHAGAVELVDIGLGPHLPDEPAVEVLQAADVHALLPTAGADRESDKYRRGVVGVSAGSQQYTGAAVLCVGGAVRGGAGMVRYVGDEAPTELVRRRWPEVVVGEGRVQAWTVGSGGGDGAAERLAAALKADVPVLVDADALSAFADQPRHGSHRPAHPACRRAGPAAGCRAGRGRGAPAGARPPGRGRARRSRPAQGLHHGRGHARRPGAGQPDRDRRARDGRHRGRAGRAVRRAARRRARPARCRLGRCLGARARRTARC